MKNVLIPTDFSNNSLNAFEFALNFFKDETINFHFLHVVIPENFESQQTQYFSSVNVLEKVDLKPSIKKLQSIVKKIRTANNNINYRFFTLVDHGYFVDTVRKQISEKQIDIIVMGTKGSSKIKNMLIGSNTADIITKVKCTTLVIPENAKFKIPKQIVFPSDFSTSYSVQNLEPLLEIIERYNSSLIALYLNNNKNEPIYSQQEINREYFIDCFHENELSFHYISDKHLDEGIDTFNNSREISMIAMMAKKLNFFNQILFKPNIKEVTYHTDIPFLILHE